MPDCSSCEQMRKENKQLRTALTDTNRNYVEVVNENLKFKSLLEEAGIYYHGK